MVQLKSQEMISLRDQHRRFNSCMVQLKWDTRRATILVAWF